MTVKVSILDQVLQVCNTVFHQGVAVIGTFILWVLCYYQPADSLFTWHTILCTLGYLPVMTEAIILFSGDNVWTKTINRTIRSYIHAIIGVLSIACVTVGNAFVIYNNREGRHFTTTHGWTALVSWVFTLLSLFLGEFAVHSQRLKMIAPPVVFKFCHNLLALVAYFFGIVSLYYGLQKGTFKRHVQKEALDGLSWSLFLISVWTALAALRSGYNQLKTIVGK